MPPNGTRESAGHITAFTGQTGAASKFDYAEPEQSHAGSITDVAAAGLPRASSRRGSRVRRPGGVKKRTRTRR